MKNSAFRSYVLAGCIWLGLLLGGVGIMAIYRIGNTPDFQETFGRPPDETASYVCATNVVWQDDVNYVPCPFRDFLFQEIEDTVLWLITIFAILVFSPSGLFGLFDGEATMLLFVLLLLSPWVFIPFVGYGISRFNRWKSAGRLRRSEPPPTPPS